jgi:hypothetical protein
MRSFDAKIPPKIQPSTKTLSNILSNFPFFIIINEILKKIKLWVVVEEICHISRHFVVFFLQL